jgi:hypothetical protein
MIKDLKGEKWRVCTDWPLYCVSNKGRIKRIGHIDSRGRRWPEQLLKATNAECSLRKEGKSFWVPLAALILRAFVGPPPSLSESISRHLDDDRTNNRLGNLAWGTQKDNVRDAVNNGLFSGRTQSSESNELRRIASTGRRHSIETKQKMSKANLLRVESERAAGIRRIRPTELTFAGRSHTEEHKQYLADKLRGNTYTEGRIWITDGIKTRMVFPGAVPVGWVEGRKKR